jgi:hypothetical protein
MSVKNTANTMLMPIYNCSCGMQILIVPDLSEMVTAIKNHVSVHRKITGQRLSEGFLTQEILKTICDFR